MPRDLLDRFVEMRWIGVAAEFSGGLLKQLGLAHIRRSRSRFLHEATLAEKFIFADKAGRPASARVARERIVVAHQGRDFPTPTIKRRPEYREHSRAESRW
jgi:hypothetical protein